MSTWKKSSSNRTSIVKLLTHMSERCINKQNKIHFDNIFTKPYELIETMDSERDNNVIHSVVSQISDRYVCVPVIFFNPYPFFIFVQNSDTL